MASNPIVNKTEAKYYAALELAAKSKAQKDLMTLQWIKLMMGRIPEAKSIANREGIHSLHSRVKEALYNYDIVETTGKNAKDTRKKLVYKLEGSQTGKEIVALEESYSIVKNAHKFTSHGGIDAMTEWLSNSNITVAEICLPVIIEICKTCRRGLRERPYKSIATVCIVDMSQQEQTDELFNWLLVYQDKNTKFLQFRPISSWDLIESVSIELIHLLTDLGPPECIQVQPSLKKTFENILTNRLNVFFDTNIVLESSDASTSLVRDVEYQLANWMIRNPNATWSVGCLVVQWELNNTSRENRQSSFDKIFAPSTKNRRYSPISVQAPELEGEIVSKNVSKYTIPANPSDHQEVILETIVTVKQERHLDGLKAETPETKDIDEFISQNPALELPFDLYDVDIEFDVNRLNINN